MQSITWIPKTEVKVLYYELLIALCFIKLFQNQDKNSFVHSKENRFIYFKLGYYDVSVTKTESVATVNISNYIWFRIVEVEWNPNCYDPIYVLSNGLNSKIININQIL